MHVGVRGQVRLRVRDLCGGQTEITNYSPAASSSRLWGKYQGNGNRLEGNDADCAGSLEKCYKTAGSEQIYHLIYFNSGSQIRTRRRNLIGSTPRSAGQASCLQGQKKMGFINETLDNYGKSK